MDITKEDLEEIVKLYFTDTPTGEISVVDGLLAIANAIEELTKVIAGK